MHRYCYSLLFAIGVLLVGCRDSTTDSTSDIHFSEPLIAKTLEKVRQEYVETPDERKMLEGALNGMLMALDPYSTFLNPESYKIFTQSSKGEFGGLGIEVLFNDSVLKVVSPMDDMPAQKAGIKPGDMITHIDNTPIAGLAPDEVLKRLHGNPGTSVSLKITRGMEAPFPVKITREHIIYNPIKHRIEGNIGYIRISYFNDQTTEKLKLAISALQKSLGKSLQGIILDLRNNPGGSPEQAVSVSSLFLDSGIIVHIKGRKEANNQTLKATQKDLLKDIPMAILINQGSASASEIVAAALRDNHRAVLIGEKSFGKGSIQGLYALESYGGIKITIARFYTPKGEEIQGRGIQPDILLPQKTLESLKTPPTKETSADDAQLQRALDVLKGLWVVKIRP
ncbi:MAG: S41 family peptidase [Candidatus Paracaedibacter sp.]